MESIASPADVILTVHFCHSWASCGAAEVFQERLAHFARRFFENLML